MTWSSHLVSSLSLCRLRRPSVPDASRHPPEPNFSFDSIRFDSSPTPAADFHINSPRPAIRAGHDCSSLPRSRHYYLLQLIPSPSLLLNRVQVLASNGVDPPAALAGEAAPPTAPPPPPLRLHAILPAPPLLLLLFLFFLAEKDRRRRRLPAPLPLLLPPPAPALRRLLPPRLLPRPAPLPLPPPARPPPPSPPPPPPSLLLPTGTGRQTERGAHTKLLIVVTPTRARAAQASHLTRMGHALRLVRPPVLWVVVQAGDPTPEAAAVLRSTAVMHRYVGTGTGDGEGLNASSSPLDHHRPRQMNAALHLVESHRLDGIVYFADEGGVYSPHLFHRMRKIRRFGTWPVPVLLSHDTSRDDDDDDDDDGGGGVVLQGPVCKDGRVVGWRHASEDAASKLRRFHVATSGFAFNSTMLWDPRLRSRLAWNAIRHPDTMKQGFQGRTAFVEQLVEDESQMEGVPADCSQIMNWHVPFGSENRNLASYYYYPKGWRVATNLDVTIPLK